MRRLPRLLAAVAVLALVPTVAVAQTDLRDQLDDARGERERVEADLEEIQREEGDARVRLAAVEAELAGAEQALEALGSQLEAAQAEFDLADRRTREARDRLLEIDGSLAAAEAELAAKRERLENRVRAAFKYGHASFADVFVAFTEAADVADLINSGTYLAHILNDDKELLEDVSGLLADIDAQRIEANGLRRDAEREAATAAAAAAEVERAAAEQQRLTELIREQQGEREAALEALRKDRAAIEGHLAGLEAESSRIEDQLAAIARQQAEEQARVEEAARRAAEQAAAAAAAAQAACEADAGADAGADEGADGGADAGAADPGDGSEAAAGDAADPGEPVEGAGEGAGGATDCTPPGTSAAPAEPAPTGGWTRPVGGRLTSSFGPRWGRNHNGVDLAGAVGSGVVAAQAGVVVHVTNGCDPISSWGCGGGFGNYVTVSHAGGMATIYAHLSAVNVGAGQQVGAGQSIGAVGNSGNSYGPHLHFEVRDAGVPKNPCSYISC